MKRQVLLFSLLFLSIIGIHARNFILNGVNYNITSTLPGRVSIVSGGNYTGNLVIPSTVINNDTTFIVSAVSTGAFSGSNGLTSLTLPNSVTGIANQAFTNCTNLAQIIIGDSTSTGLKSPVFVSSDAFSGCTGLTSLSLNLPIYISGYVSQDMIPSLTTLIIGNSFTTIDSNTFSNLTGLKKIILGRPSLDPATITVYMDAFKKSTNLEILNLNCNLVLKNYVTNASSPFSTISTLSIGEKVSSIGDYAFIGCKNLKNIQLPTTLNTIGLSAFSGCSSLLNINTNNANNTYSSIDGVLFTKDQQTLIQYPIGRNEDYIMPTSTKIIGTNAFLSSSGIKSVTIPQSITSIQSSAFANCTNLTSVTIGHADSISSAVVSVATNSFSGCQSIEKLILNKTFSFSSGNYSPFKNLTSIKILQIGNGLISIPAYAFFGCTGLTSVRLGQGTSAGSNVITVSGSSFAACANLSTLELNRSINCNDYQSPFVSITDLTVGDGVVFIGDQTFSQCVNLKAAILPPSVLKIGNSAFQNCSKLQSVSFPGVNTIGDGAFYNCTSLTSVTIPNSMKVIQRYTFYGCTSLSSVSFGNSITDIQESAFENCSNLSTVIIPNTTKTIGSRSFSGCSALTALTLGTSQTNIGTYCFSGCIALQSVQFPRQLTSLSDNVFENCKGLSVLIIPSSMIYIGSNAFLNCSGITTLTIGDADTPGSLLNMSSTPFSGCTGVKTLVLNKDFGGESPFRSLSSLENVTISTRVTQLNIFAFYNCSKIKSLTIPNSVISIGASSFYGCSSLTNIKLPDKLESIGNSAFWGCSNLQSLSIPATVSAIGNYAFYQCSALTSLTLPKNVIVIGGAAFGGCSGLNELIAASVTPAALGLGCFDKVTTTNCKLYVPTGKKVIYQTANQWKDFASIIEKEINDTAVVSDSTVYPDPITGETKTITISAGGLLSALTSAELASVNKLTVLGSINAADFLILRDSMPVLNVLDLNKASIESYTGNLGTGGNTSISYTANTVPVNAFFNQTTYKGKNSLGTLILPETVTCISDNAFKQCGGLKGSFTLPPALKSIGSYAFYWCMGMTGPLIVPSTVTTIAEAAFNRCHGITTVTLPSSITSIERATFAECNGLMAVFIPSSVTTIKQSAFYNCGSLISINIPSSVTSIEDNAFVYCGFPTITLPESITKISDYAFTECHALQSINIPSTVNQIGTSAFLRCYSLANIYSYAATPPAVPDSYAFNYVDKNTCILYVPAGCVKAYQQASAWKDFVNIREMVQTDIIQHVIPAISFYPNPVNDGFYMGGMTEAGTLTLITVNGNVVLTRPVQGNEYISISTLPEGLYIAKIVTKSFSIERKIIKK